MRWGDIAFHPPTRTLRWFALYAVLLFAALAVWLWRSNDDIEALILLLLALAFAIAGVVRADVLRPIFVGAMFATFPIGWLISHLMLTILFVGMFVPLGLLFRCIGRDALALRIRPEYKSYWTDKPTPDSVRSYFHQS